MTLLEVEDVLHSASIGFWNIKIVLMFSMACLMCGTASMFYPLAFAEMDFMCSNATSIKNQCFYIMKNNSTVACSQFDYFSGDFESTARKDFNLICGREMFADMDLSLMLSAQCISAIFGNFLMDAFGRKPVFILSCWLAALSSLGYLFAPTIQILLLLRFIECFALMLLLFSGILMMLENHQVQYSFYVTNSKSYLYGIGYSLCAVVSFFFRDWRSYVTIRLVIPSFIAAVLSLFLVDESLRWLLQKRKFTEFDLVVCKMFTSNNIEIPSSFVQEINILKKQAALGNDYTSIFDQISSKVSTLKFWELYSTGKTSIWMGALALSWIGCVVVYFGMQFGRELFGGVQIHIYFMISGVADIPGSLFQLYVAKNWGRKPANVVSFVFCALSLLISPFIPRNGYWIILLYITAFSTKVFITSAFTNIYMWNAEILPTNFRGVGIGLGSLCGRIVGIPLPYVKQLSKMWAPLPAFMFALIAIAAAVTSLVVPETRNQISPDDIEEFQVFGTNEYIVLKNKRLEVLRKNAKILIK